MSDTIEIPTPDPHALQVIRESSDLALAKFQEVKSITTAEEYEFCGEAARDIATLIKRYEDMRKPTIDTLHKAHKAELARLAGEVKDLKTTAAKIDDLQRDYLRRKREDELAAAREAQRLEDERRALLVQASIAEHEGENAVAQALDEEAEDLKFEIVAAQQAAPIPKVAGQAVRYQWKARIVNPALIPFDNRKFWILDEAKINALVRTMGADHGIPGVEAYEEPIPVTKRR